MHIQLIIFVAIYMIHSLFTWISKSINTYVSLWTQIHLQQYSYSLERIYKIIWSKSMKTWATRYALSEEGERKNIFWFL